MCMVHEHSLPAEVALVIDWWLPRIRTCLGENLRAVVLTGSTALDDFCPRWSDIDVCVVLENPITRDEGDVIGTVHDEMRRIFIEVREGGWESGQAIEGSYISVELARRRLLVAPCYTAGGTTRRWAVGNPLTPFDRYMLVHYGTTIAGERITFEHPVVDELAEQTNHDVVGMRDWNADSNQSAIWMAGMLHWLARSIVFWRDGRLMSKSAALRHEIEHQSEFNNAFALSLEVRHAGRATAAVRYAELRACLDTMAARSACDLERYVRERLDAPPEK